MIINNVTDCTIEMYDKATRGQLEVLNQTGKEQPVDKLYDAYISITDEFNSRIDSTNYTIEVETMASNQYYSVKISRIKLGVRVLDLMVENSAFGTPEAIELAEKAMTGGGVKWTKNDFSKILSRAKAKISYYENQIAVNDEKMKSLKSDDSKKGSIYSLVSLLRNEGVTVSRDDSLIILADCLNNLNRKIKEQNKKHKK